MIYLLLIFDFISLSSGQVIPLPNVLPLKRPPIPPPPPPLPLPPPPPPPLPIPHPVPPPPPPPLARPILPFSFSPLLVPWLKPLLKPWPKYRPTSTKLSTTTSSPKSTTKTTQKSNTTEVKVTKRQSTTVTEAKASNKTETVSKPQIKSSSRKVNSCNETGGEVGTGISVGTLDIVFDADHKKEGTKIDNTVKDTVKKVLEERKKYHDRTGGAIASRNVDGSVAVLIRTLHMGCKHKAAFDAAIMESLCNVRSFNSTCH